MMGEPRAVLLPAPDAPGYDELPDDEEARRALPARFHIPIWVDTGTPKLWACAVCWGDGWGTQWPCEAAVKHGSEVFEAFGDDRSRRLRSALAVMEGTHG